MRFANLYLCQVSILQSQCQVKIETQSKRKTKRFLLTETNFIKRIINEIELKSHISYGISISSYISDFCTTANPVLLAIQLA